MVLWVASYENNDSSGCVAKLTVQDAVKPGSIGPMSFHPLYVMTSSHRLQTILETALLEPGTEFGVEIYGRKLVPRPECPWCAGWDTDYPVYSVTQVKLYRL